MSSKATDQQTVVIGRILASLCVVGILAAYPTLYERLTEAGGARAIAFYVAYAETIVASVLLLVSLPKVWSAALVVAKSSPLRSLLFVVNAGICTVLILCVGRHWGVIALMVIASSVVIWLAFAANDTRLAIMRETVRCSPISFLVLYLSIAIGEVYLQSHPMDVGGGGGSNPALDRLYAGLYSYNSLGLRGSEFLPERPAGTFRILALGDSFTFGQGVAAADTYVKRIESSLNEHATNQRFEVINAGKCGVNTKWEFDYLTRSGLRLEPNMVIVQFFENDLEKMYEETKSQSLLDWLRRPLRRSYALFWLRDRIGRCLARVDNARLGSGLADSIVENRPGWRACANALDGLGAVAKKTAIPIVVVLFPPTGHVQVSTRAIHKAVADRCTQAGLRVIDLAGAFDDIGSEDQVVSRIDSHPSAAVHCVAAERILSRLREDGLVPPSGNTGRHEE